MTNHHSRIADGHRYELIINHVDAGSGPFTQWIPASWELLRDGLPVENRDEAHRLRREVFGEWESS